MNFSPFPVLNTDRLILRALSETDKEAIFLLRSDDKVNEFIDRKKPANSDEALTFINDIKSRVDKGESVYWAIWLKDKPELIGTVCLWNFSTDNDVAELGYEMNTLFQRQGLMTEAVSCVIRYSFEKLHFKVLEAFTNKNNERSIKLLQKLGFTLLPDRVDEDYPLNIIFELKNTIGKSPVSR